MFDPTLGYDDLDWVRASWPGHLARSRASKILGDAQAAVQHGVDAVLVSSHGGRQLDRAASPLEILPDIVRTVGGKAEVWLDTGVMSGGDVVAAIALGADLCLVGRAYLYGLMAGGERGVQRATEILRAEIVRTMRLLGVGSLGELTHRHVSLRSPARDAWNASRTPSPAVEAKWRT